MMTLIAQTQAEPDGVNILPIIVLVILLLAAAAAVYARKQRS